MQGKSVCLIVKLSNKFPHPLVKPNQALVKSNPQLTGQ